MFLVILGVWLDLNLKILVTLVRIYDLIGLPWVLQVVRLFRNECKDLLVDVVYRNVFLLFCKQDQVLEAIGLFGLFSLLVVTLFVLFFTFLLRVMLVQVFELLGLDIVLRNDFEVQNTI
jgi:hypothetical protein